MCLHQIKIGKSIEKIHTSPLNSIPSFPHCSIQWQEIPVKLKNNKPKWQNQCQSRRTNTDYVKWGHTPHRGDTHNRVLQVARNQEWLHTLGGGRHGLPVEHRDGNGSLADAILTALGGTAHTLQQEVRVTLDGFHCHMSNPAAWGTWRHESDVKGRETKKQKIKTNNRQKWHKQRHGNTSREAKLTPELQWWTMLFYKCFFQLNHKNICFNAHAITHRPRLQSWLLKCKRESKMWYSLKCMWSHCICSVNATVICPDASCTNYSPVNHPLQYNM